jgi:hypothetical protein
MNIEVGSYEYELICKRTLFFCGLYKWIEDNYKDWMVFFNVRVNRDEKTFDCAEFISMYKHANIPSIDKKSNSFQFIFYMSPIKFEDSNRNKYFNDSVVLTFTGEIIIDESNDMDFIITADPVGKTEDSDWWEMNQDILIKETHLHNLTESLNKQFLDDNFIKDSRYFFDKKIIKDVAVQINNFMIEKMRLIIMTSKIGYTLYDFWDIEYF